MKLNSLGRIPFQGVEDDEDIHSRLRIKRPKKEKKKRENHGSEAVKPELLSEKVKEMDAKLAQRIMPDKVKERLQIESDQQAAHVRTLKEKPPKQESVHEGESLPMYLIREFESEIVQKVLIKLFDVLAIHKLRIFLYSILHEQDDNYTDKIEYERMLKSVQLHLETSKLHREKFTPSDPDCIFHEDIPPKLRSRKIEDIKIPDIVMKRLNLERSS